MRSSWRIEPWWWLRFTVLTAALLAVGYLAARSAAIRALPLQSPLLQVVAPGDARVVLDRLTATIMTAKVPPPPAAYAPLASAAGDAPLDERPFLLMAVKNLAGGQNIDGLRLLEEARRRNPRQRYVRLLLLDRYFRANRVGDAVTEMAVLTRLLPAAENILAAAMAGFAINPATARQARRALDGDPALLNKVLVAMADKTDPAAVMRFAGARAPTGLEPVGWRTAMITAMTARGQYAEARQLWQRAYRIDDSRASEAIHDSVLQGHVAGAPFGWVLAADEVGVGEISGGALAVEYYGRKTGSLASQLVVLASGAYRLSYAVSGSGGDSTGLVWLLICRGRAGTVLVTSPTSLLRPVARRVTADLTVPTEGCPAQQLMLEGRSGDFAGSTSARFTHLSLDRMQ